MLARYISARDTSARGAIDAIHMPVILTHARHMRARHIHARIWPRRPEVPRGISLRQIQTQYVLVYSIISSCYGSMQNNAEVRKYSSCSSIHNSILILPPLNKKTETRHYKKLWGCFGTTEGRYSETESIYH